MPATPPPPESNGRPLTFWCICSKQNLTLSSSKGSPTPPFMFSGVVRKKEIKCLPHLDFVVAGACVLHRHIKIHRLNNVNSNKFPNVFLHTLSGLMDRQTSTASQIYYKKLRLRGIFIYTLYFYICTIMSISIWTLIDVFDLISCST